LSPGAADSDATLAERALGGDDSAFAQLISRHKSWMFRFIRRYVGNAEDAYDVLQDAFFSAWLALGRYQGDRPFEFWLRRIALNKCRDRARREGVRRVLWGLLGEEDGAPSVIDSAAGPERIAAARQDLRQLELALNSLPRALKEPLLLTALEGLSHKEAGELLGLNPKAVEMRVYRARARLAVLVGASDQK
jgi:RNA polymerase sigma factor (sigma-70 family)